MEPQITEIVKDDDDRIIMAGFVYKFWKEDGDNRFVECLLVLCQFEFCDVNVPIFVSIDSLFRRVTARNGPISGSDTNSMTLH